MPKPLGSAAHVLRRVRPPSGLRPVRVAAAAAPLRPWRGGAGDGVEGIARDVAMVGWQVTKPASEKGFTTWRGVIDPNWASND